MGGADADWIIETTLWDCKVSRQRRPFRADYLQQSLGYLLLDYSDIYHIDTLGWYFPRQRLRLHYGIADVLMVLIAGTADWRDQLLRLRKSFQQAIAKV